MVLPIDFCSHPINVCVVLISCMGLVMQITVADLGVGELGDQNPPQEYNHTPQIKFKVLL